MHDDRQHTGIIMIQLDSKVNFLMKCRRLKNDVEAEHERKR